MDTGDCVRGASCGGGKDVLSKDVLGEDVLTADVLSKDVLSEDVLSGASPALSPVEASGGKALSDGAAEAGAGSKLDAEALGAAVTKDEAQVEVAELVAVDDSVGLPPPWEVLAAEPRGVAPSVSTLSGLLLTVPLESFCGEKLEAADALGLRAKNEGGEEEGDGPAL